jgi:hypothetical protein
MLMRPLALLFCASLATCTGCGIVDGSVAAVGGLFNPQRKPKSQLEIREMQTQEFDTTATKTVLKAMLNVLQDDDFMIKQVNPEMGFFSGTKTLDTEDSLAKTWGYLWWGPSAQWVENTVVDCTANVSEFGDKTRVRVNFQAKLMNNKGGVEKVSTVDDPKFYQTFFSKVSKGIFIEESEI